MDTCSHKSVSIDLFNLPPLSNEQNKEESCMDVPYNYYIPDGKNSRLLDRTDRVEFDRETIGGNTGFKLEFHIWNMHSAPNTSSWTELQVL